jgi:uncharacterized phage infection (PIP) family protein YhgE
LTIDPLLFLACSTLLVAVSLTALVVAAFPAIQDVSRAARSAEKLFDRLDRELSPTLEAIRIAGLELSDLSDEVSQGVQSASAVVQQVDIGLTEVKKQAGNARLTTQSVWVGVKAAWQTWRRGESLPPEQLSSVRKASLAASSDLDPATRQLRSPNPKFDRSQGSIVEDEDS